MLIEYTDPRNIPNLELEIAKPDRTIIGTIPEAFGQNQVIKLGQINEINFTIPFMIEKNFMLQRNPNVDKLKSKYLVRATFDTQQEWYIVSNLKSTFNSDGRELLNVSLFSLGIQLADKKIRTWSGVYVNGEYRKESLNAQQVLEDLLSVSTWGIDYIDSEFLTKYRAFDFTNTNVLDAIYLVATTFNGILQWNTENKTISLVKQENVGTNKGFRVSYGKYLKSLNREEKSDEVITRLRVYGKDGLSINRVNPSGSDYLEDYSYFMYPFQRDVNKNTISSSDYMSDSLCHTLLDYSALLETKKTEFDSLLSQKETLQSQKTIKENEIFGLQTELDLVLDRLDIQRTTGALRIFDYTYSGTVTTSTTSLVNTNKYTVMVKVSSTTDLTVKLDGSIKTLTANTWSVLGKISNGISTSVEVSGIATNVKVDIYVAKITDTEFTTTDNESTLIDTYNDKYKQSQVDLKQSEINGIDSDIANVDNQISTLKSSVSMESNFTAAQIQELNNFIIEDTWEDANYYDDKELYKDAQKVFSELNKPKSIIDIDIVNLFKLIEAKKDWNKVKIGDKFYIYYEKFGIDVESQIVEMNINHDSYSIKLTIANTTDIERDEEKLSKIIYKSISTSSTINMNKYKWDTVSNVSNTVSDLINNTWESAERAITAGVNESVAINRRGVTISDPTDPNKFIRMTHGAIGLTVDGGNTYKTAILPDRIVAERVLGKLIAGNNLQIQNESGNYTIDGNGFTITSTDTNKRVLLDVDNGLKFQVKEGTAYKDKLYYDTLNDRISLIGELDADELKVKGVSVLTEDKVKINGQYIDKITTDQLVAGTAKISTALIENLVVGSNVTMGSTASISWSQVTGQPNMTYIDANGVYTGTLSANQIFGGTITGVTINVNTDLRVGDNVYIGDPFSTGQKALVFKNDTWIYTSGDGLAFDSFGWLQFLSYSKFYNTVDFSTANVIGLATAKFG